MSFRTDGEKNKVKEILVYCRIIVGGNSILLLLLVYHGGILVGSTVLTQGMGRGAVGERGGCCFCFRGIRH